MAMNPGTVAAEIAAYFETNLDTTRDWRTYDLGTVISVAFDKEFQRATRSNPNFLISPPAGSLDIHSCLTIYPDANTARNFAVCIGNKVAGYWAKAIGLGQPCHEDFVKAVTNDAHKIAMPIASGLISLMYKELQVPYWLDFANVIISNVRTIMWNVIECRHTHGGLSCNTYTEFIM